MPYRFFATPEPIREQIVYFMVGTASKNAKGVTRSSNRGERRSIDLRRQRPCDSAFVRLCVRACLRVRARTWLTYGHSFSRPRVLTRLSGVEVRRTRNFKKDSVIKALFTKLHFVPSCEGSTTQFFSLAEPRGNTFEI